jgi:hypothetical protein
MQELELRLPSGRVLDRGGTSSAQVAANAAGGSWRHDESDLAELTKLSGVRHVVLAPRDAVVSDPARNRPLREAHGGPPVGNPLFQCLAGRGRRMGERSGRILVVDDDPLRPLLSRAPESAGHRVRSACDAEFATEMIDQFLVDAPVLVATIGDGLTTAEPEAVPSSRHTLKSNAATFGGPSPCRMPQNLGGVLEDGRPSRCRNTGRRDRNGVRPRA